jgi:hypothetical protein
MFTSPSGRCYPLIVAYLAAPLQLPSRATTVGDSLPETFLDIWAIGILYLYNRCVLVCNAMGEK